MAITSRMCRTVLLSLFFSFLFLAPGLLPAGAPNAGAVESPAQSKSRKTPKVSLTATPAFGFTPLAVQLVATLSGVGSRDSNFCHAGVTWVRIDPGSSPETGAKMSELPRCVHSEDKIFVPTTFSKSFDLISPGSYLYRVIIETKDGSQIKSNFVTIRVLRVP